MKLADATVKAKARTMRDLFRSAALELWDDETLLVRMALRSLEVDGGTVRAGPTATATALASGMPTRYRIVRDGELVVEGATGPELQMETRDGPVFAIEKGAAVTMAELTYTEPVG